jgi:hypothetical protein
LLTVFNWAQVLYALHVAGKTFSFSHYGTLTAPACPKVCVADRGCPHCSDLHHKNILLCSLPMEDGCCVYYHKGVAYYNQTCIVKIAGAYKLFSTAALGSMMITSSTNLGQC